MREDRFTWKKGDAIITDRDGHVIDVDKLGKPEERAENGEEQR